MEAEIVETKQYIILDVHPEDFFYEFRDEFIGKIIDVSYCRTSRSVDQNYMYCVGKFEEPIFSENIIIQDIVFKAVKLGELENADYRSSSETKTR